MDVIFDWNLGNMIYNDRITLRHCGFPFVEIGFVSAAAGQARWPTLAPSRGAGGTAGRPRPSGLVPGSCAVGRGPRVEAME